MREREEEDEEEAEREKSGRKWSEVGNNEVEEE